MVQNKQKTAKPPKLLKGAAKEPALSKAENWQKVKIKGHVISDDCGGYEGLIGLEVLKDYDASLVKSSAKRTTSRNPDRERKLKKKKRKVSKGDEAESSESSTESESEDEVAIAARTSKKARMAERHAQKMQKLREKREKRKELRKQKKSKGKENDNSEESSDEHAADRFALLRPPPSDDEEEEVAKAEDSADQQESSDEEAPELVPIPTDEAEDVSAWNGLGVPASILRALGEQGFKTPTQIQALTLPAAIHGKKDILGAAETGSGKLWPLAYPCSRNHGAEAKEYSLWHTQGAQGEGTAAGASGR
ncbi:GD25288 [Drosophila simulans]|uniref:RNA helicase n=1 Tax=Drosophila simulans TaxID=7240 RepID=B4QEL9_DROSI|nr:GD25288 [Drosophila simulans]